MPSDPSFGYVFPAIKGIQARREYFVSMCPLRLIPKLFLFDEAELGPEMRAQRVLDKNRVPEITRYILENRDDYTFSALTASIDAEVSFEPIGAAGEASRVGVLHVPMDARFIINDGQHRRAAVEAALKQATDLGDETIAVVFFLDVGLARCQQMFADLNRHAVRPSTSLGVLYDHRDDRAQLARLIVLKSKLFRDTVEMERSTLSARSRKLFTLSAIYNATSDLLDGLEIRDRQHAATIAIDFWEETAKHIPEWQRVRDKTLPAGDVRRDLIHSHGIALQALARLGNALLRSGNEWRRRLKGLEAIDWRRSNARVWEGRAMIGGKVTKGTLNVVLTTNVLKKALNVELSPEEEHAENARRRGNSSR